MNNYVEQAIVTKSPDFHGHLVTKEEFLRRVKAAVIALQAVDQLKKCLFYARAMMTGDELQGAEDCRSLASGWEVMGSTHHDWDVYSEQRAIDVIHSILGVATEGGELLELMLKTIESKVFDDVNFAEEIGDCQWYDAIGANAVQWSFDRIQDRNIAKLRKRFGGKFTAFDANNRKLDDERETLETKVIPSPGGLTWNGPAGEAADPV